MNTTKSGKKFNFLGENLGYNVEVGRHMDVFGCLYGIEYDLQLAKV